MANMILDEKQAIERIAKGRNRGFVDGKKISCSNPGLKVLSAIDCLCHYHGYVWYKGDRLMA